MANTFLLSDTHFGHVNLLRYQPDRLRLLGLPADATIAEHDEALLERLNSVIRPGDEVWHLGDLVMGNRQVTIPFTARLHGTKVIVAPGNHDHGLWPEARAPTAVDHLRRLYRDAGWALPEPGAPLDGVYTVDGSVVYGYSHLPLAGTPDHDPELIRFAARMLPDDGRPHVHGHSHGALGRVHGNGPVANQFDVGIDANELWPTSLDEVLDWARAVARVTG